MVVAEDELVAAALSAPVVPCDSFSCGNGFAGTSLELAALELAAAVSTFERGAGWFSVEAPPAVSTLIALLPLPASGAEMEGEVISRTS